MGWTVRHGEYRDVSSINDSHQLAAPAVDAKVCGRWLSSESPPAALIQG
jgi:hypothetical protein